MRHVRPVVVLPLGAPANQASRISASSGSLDRRRLRASAFASFQTARAAAEYASAHRAARTPGTLFAAMEAPVPVQQQTTAWSARPSATSRAAALGAPGPVLAVAGAQRTVGGHGVAAAAQLVDEPAARPARPCPRKQRCAYARAYARG